MASLDFIITAWKVSKILTQIQILSNIYSVNLRIQSEYGKIRRRKSSVFGYFSHSELFVLYKMRMEIKLLPFFSFFTNISFYPQISKVKYRWVKCHRTVTFRGVRGVYPPPPRMFKRKKTFEKIYYKYSFIYFKLIFEAPESLKLLIFLKFPGKICLWLQLP